MNSGAIGIFDSGLGGLTVWAEVRCALPTESIIYLADGKNCPYGSLTKGRITELTINAVERLIKLNCKLIVIACNTATAAAIETLRERYPQVPIVGMEPAIKPACKATKSGVVGVLATKGSLEGAMFRNTKELYGKDIEVIASEGEGFVEAVESGEIESAKTEELVRRVVQPMVERGADTIVLGCTHYPLLLPVIERITQPHLIKIIDPSPAIARRVVQLLKDNNLQANVEHRAEYQFMTFGNEEYLQRIENMANRVVECNKI